VVFTSDVPIDWYLYPKLTRSLRFENLKTWMLRGIVWTDRAMLIDRPFMVPATGWTQVWMRVNWSESQTGEYTAMGGVPTVVLFGAICAPAGAGAVPEVNST